MTKHLLTTLGLLVFLGVLSACQGTSSDKPPFHLNPNMDTQAKYKPYKESEWFEDKRAMRPHVPGTVARGKLKEDPHYYRGKVGGKFSDKYPKQVTFNRNLLDRGKQRFEIYCSVCHDAAGTGKGLVGLKLAVKPTNLHSDYMHSLPKGHFFDVITNGIRTMPSYGSQIPEADRWAIVAYIRTLQLSQDMNNQKLRRK